MDELENGWKAVGVPLVFWWEVAPGKKGLEVRRKKQIVRPATGTRQHLAREHERPIDVGSFFSVHFDVDEPLIHQSSDRGIGVDRPLGDVAPNNKCCSQWRERSACSPPLPWQKPPRPTGTSRPDCGHAATDRD